MASVEVTSAAILTGTTVDRAVVRTSTGVVYVCVVDSGNVQMWKGNAQPPTSFTEQDAGNAPNDIDFIVPSIAIDSNDIISVIWWDRATGHGETGGPRYQRFNTVDAASNKDLWDSGGSELAFTKNATPTNFGTSIAIDANDVPHIVVVDEFSNMGAKDTVMYANKIGGSWNTAVEVEGATAAVVCNRCAITFAKDSGGTIVPQIVYVNVDDTDVGSAIGNVLNATSFTLFDVETTGSATDKASIACDSARDNTYIALRNSFSDLKIRKHINTNGWTTWETAIVVDSTDNWSNASLAIDGTNLYIFSEKISTNDIHLWLDEGSGFTDNGAFEADTDNDVHAKWSSYNNNEGDTQIDFVFERGSSVRWNEHILSAVTVVTKTHDTDSVLKALDNEITHTTDSVLKALDNEINHTTDSFLKAIRTETHDTDSVLKALDNEITHTTDSVLKKLDTEITHTTDSFLVNIVLVTHTTDSVLRAIDNEITHDTDSVLKAIDNELTHTTDSVLAFVVTVAHDTDSVLKALDQTLTHNTDSVLKALDNEITHTTDSVLKELDNEITHTTDSFLLAIRTLTHTTDSVLKKLDTEITHTTDSFLAAGVTVVTVIHTTDSVLKALDNEITHDTDSVLRQIDNEITHTTDSILGEREPGISVIHTTDSILKQLDNEIIHTTDSHLFAERTLTHTTDSLLVTKVEVTHTTDSVLKELDNEISHTTDSVLKSLDDEITHTTDSHLFAERTLTHTTDSHLLAIRTLTHDTDSVLKKLDNLVTHTTDSFLSAGVLVVTVTHTTDSLVVIGVIVSHTTDSILRQLDNEITHTTDSIVRFPPIKQIEVELCR
ncbi:hypothetical protein LCGC14_1053770 [marine sediment metagenome]|uniref:Uncharacterized protein n=1 Tax=marine sediment metagenome TaxID=412755 RepID=A0A0F9N9V1_9ZZZZ